MDIGWVLHLADVSAVVGELDLSNYDGGIAAHDVTSPGNALSEESFLWKKWFPLVVKYLQEKFVGYI